MGLKPFVPLDVPRVVDRPDYLPIDLVAFYSTHEPVDRGSDQTIELYPPDEVTRVGWKNISNADPPKGWGAFTGFQIGMGSYFTKILYVLTAPTCPAGSILAIGTYLVGWAREDGDPDAIDGAVVVAPSFPAWLAHLERWEWDEPVCVGVGGYPRPEWEELRRYYLAFNPNMDWGPET